MSDKRAHRTGRSNRVHNGPVNVLPKDLTNSDEFRSLPPNACKLLLAILPQFNGRGWNNGSLMILMRQPKRYGFRSAGTLTSARNDLPRFGFLQLTRQGGRHLPSLYALTWEGIDNVKGIDVKDDPKPSHLWRSENASAREWPSSDRRKNTIRAPLLGTQSRATAPSSGTLPRPIALGTGAVAAQSDGFGVPETGTDSCIAMCSATELLVQGQHSSGARQVDEHSEGPR